METGYAIGSSVWPGTAKLIEECAELQQELGRLQQTLAKLVALGDTTSTTHWDGSDLKVKIEEEIGDVMASASFFIWKNKLRKRFIEDRCDRKFRRFKKWHEQQEKRS